jgi:hypothetical protein
LFKCSLEKAKKIASNLRENPVFHVKRNFDSRKMIRDAFEVIRFGTRVWRDARRFHAHKHVPACIESRTITTAHTVR